jgi:hypothetical protein
VDEDAADRVVTHRTPLAFAALFAACSPAMADEQPTAEMMAPVEKIAHFIAAGDAADLSAFADKGVVIVENFAPYLFEGPKAVSHWATKMRAHTAQLSNLKHSFGPAQDFGVSGALAYFSLPTHWDGISNGRSFGEDGGWAFVLTRQGREWRVLSYGWAVTRLVPE